MYNYQLKSNTEPGKGDQPIFNPKLKPKPKPGGKGKSGITWVE